MKTTERTVLGIESLEELLEGWDHIRSNRKMLRGPLILPNYFMEVDGESSIAETLARLVDNLSKDSVLMSFQGRVKSFAYYLPYTAPGESDFPGLRTFDAIYKKNLCRFGMPFEGVIAKPPRARSSSLSSPTSRRSTKKASSSSSRPPGKPSITTKPTRRSPPGPGSVT